MLNQHPWSRVARGNCAGLLVALVLVGVLAAGAATTGRADAQADPLCVSWEFQEYDTLLTRSMDLYKGTLVRQGANRTFAGTVSGPGSSNGVFLEVTLAGSTVTMNRNRGQCAYTGTVSGLTASGTYSCPGAGPGRGTSSWSAAITPAAAAAGPRLWTIDWDAMVNPGVFFVGDEIGICFTLPQEGFFTLTVEYPDFSTRVLLDDYTPGIGARSDVCPHYRLRDEVGEWCVMLEFRGASATVNLQECFFVVD